MSWSQMTATLKQHELQQTAEKDDGEEVEEEFSVLRIILAEEPLQPFPESRGQCDPIKEPSTEEGSIPLKPFRPRARARVVESTEARKKEKRPPSPWVAEKKLKSLGLPSAPWMENPYRWSYWWEKKKQEEE